MKTLVRLIAATAVMALIVALVIAIRDAGNLGGTAWWFLGPASLVVAAGFVRAARPPLRLGLALLVLTGIAWLVGAAAITAADSGSATAIGWILMGPGPFLAAGIYLLVTQPDLRMGWWLTAMAATTLAYTTALEQISYLRSADHGIETWMSWALAIDSVVATAGVVCLTLLIGLFPSGVPRDTLERRVARWAWVTPVLVILPLLTNEHVIGDGVSYGALDPVPSPLFVDGLAPLAPLTAPLRVGTGVLVLAGIALLFRRYRRGAETERRQIRWVLYASATAVAIGVFPFIVAPLLGLGSLAHSPLLTLPSLALLLIPGSMVLAVDQPAWLDTDTIIRKSFVYGGLSFGIFVIYAAVAAGLGLAAGARLPIEVAIAITAVLAVLFQPTRTRLQRIADRWVFGARPSAFEAVATFDRAMTEAHASGDLSQRLAELVRGAARLEWAEVAIPPEGPVRAGAVDGDAVHEVPISRAGEHFGEIRCGPKAAGTFTDQDGELVAALAGQAALLIANVRLAARIVHAQEAERRRIERNIHDGAQQELVALVAKLGLAREQAKRGQVDDATLLDLQRDAGAILRDLRELAQGIHPAVLTDGGIVEALEDRAGRLPIDVVVDSAPGVRHERFADDVEGAAYFFVVEGLTNILKHSSASEARVSLARENGTLELSVSDNGFGFDPAVTRLNGLAGLSDRFAALSGTVTVEAVPGSGTTLRACLPVAEAGG